MQRRESKSDRIRPIGGVFFLSPDQMMSVYYLSNGHVFSVFPALPTRPCRLLDAATERGSGDPRPYYDPICMPPKEKKNMRSGHSRPAQEQS